MRLLLTGARGLVGRNLLEHPAAADHDILTPSSRELDLRRRADVAAYIADTGVEAVIHCAGRVGGIQANIADPAGFLVENLEMGLNVVQGAHGGGVRRLLNLGSSCMYPREAENPLREDQILTGPLEPTNEGYALAKIAVSRHCDYLSSMHGDLAYRTLIPCNLYGRHDKFDPAVSHLVPAIIRKVHEARDSGADSVEIWGDGTARREFMYAADMADGVWTALARLDRMPQVMNIGIGTDYSINDYYETAARVIGWEGRFTHDLDRPTGMKQKLVSTARQEAFGWRPRVSLEDGIRRTYDFFLENNVETITETETAI